MDRTADTTPAIAIAVEAWAVAATLVSALLMKLLIS